MNSVDTHADTYYGNWCRQAAKHDLRAAWIPTSAYVDSRSAARRNAAVQARDVVLVSCAAPSRLIDTLDCRHETHAHTHTHTHAAHSGFSNPVAVAVSSMSPNPVCAMQASTHIHAPGFTIALTACHLPSYLAQELMEHGLGPRGRCARCTVHPQLHPLPHKAQGGASRLVCRADGGTARGSRCQVSGMKVGT